ncbi:MAG: dienelactone hydrolase family protein, partial [Casimicrobiaceae bacterium]
SSHARLRAIERLPATSAAARRDYRAFLDASLPRAFAVSADGRRWGWAGNDQQANERALARCGGSVRCRLYAVDERVVW